MRSGLEDGQRHTGIRVRVIWDVLGSYIVMKGMMCLPYDPKCRLGKVESVRQEGEGLLARNVTNHQGLSP